MLALDRTLDDRQSTTKKVTCVGQHLTQGHSQQLQRCSCIDLISRLQVPFQFFHPDIWPLTSSTIANFHLGSFTLLSVSHFRWILLSINHGLWRTSAPIVLRDRVHHRWNMASAAHPGRLLCAIVSLRTNTGKPSVLRLPKHEVAYRKLGIAVAYTSLDFA